MKPKQTIAAREAGLNVKVGMVDSNVHPQSPTDDQI
jgi:hypothetical protein